MLRLRIRIRDMPNRSPSAFRDHLQILPQLDPAAIWQKAAKFTLG